MENTVQRKARLILAGLAALPAIAMASGNVNQVQSNGYTDPEKETQEDLSDLQETTGLSKQELAEGKTLVHELNQLDVIICRPDQSSSHDAQSRIDFALQSGTHSSGDESALRKNPVWLDQ